MSDDLFEILSSIRTTQANLLKRIQALEAQEGTARARDWGTPFTGYGYCTPTDPPSTSVIVKGGWVWCSAVFNNNFYDYGPRGWREQTVDIASFAVAFTQANSYRWAILAQDLHQWDVFGLWDMMEFYPGLDAEFENAELACHDFDHQLKFGSDIDLEDITTFWPDPLAMPHCVLLLRNNGTTGVAGQIEPITLHDRSQSSFLLWDARPWMNLLSNYVY